MEHKLKQETVEKINQLDQSLIFWSVRLGKAMTELREIESQVKDLYDFKKNAILEDLRSQEVDIEESEIRSVDSQTVLVEKIRKQ